MLSFICLIMVSLSFFLFVKATNHALTSLILLEYMILAVYLNFVITMTSSSGVISVSILFTASATAAAVGLSLLVPLSRSHGHDYFSTFNALW